MCCPDCKKDFKLLVIKEAGGEIVSGSLVCEHCRKKYPIIEGVTVVLNEKKLKDFAKTKKNWENWWKKVRQDDDAELYERLWTEAEKNLGGEPLYKKEHFAGKVVLDAGCGTGRHIESDFSKFNCKEIIGVDIGMQVFEAKKKNNSANTHFVQADLTNLPFKKEVFDVFTSHGVLHHTPNPKYTFTCLSRHLKVGGRAMIYVYHKEWTHHSAHKKSLFLDAMYANGVMLWQGIRKVSSRMPHPVIKGFAYTMAAKASLQQALEKKGITKPLASVVKLFPPFAYLGVNFHERLIRNYDHYSATFNYFQSIEEVVEWYKQAGFNDVEIVSVPVSIRGIKEKSKPVKNNEPLRIKQYPLIEHFEFRKEWERLYNSHKRKNR